MKYLKIHKLIWLILVLAFTAVDAAMWLVAYIVYVLWEFRFPKKFWKELHQSSYSDERNGLIYEDKNIIETIKRRYKGEI